jgi:hypothetical protein
MAVEMVGQKAGCLGWIAPWRGLEGDMAQGVPSISSQRSTSWGGVQARNWATVMAVGSWLARPISGST